MSAYPVVFHMPHWISEGISSGIYSVNGGVVVETVGKQVVMWLRPVLQDGQLLAPIAPRLPLLAGGAAISTVVSAGGAVTTIVAFALLKTQLTGVEHRLDVALDKLDAIKSDTVFIRKALLASQKAQLGGALLTAKTLEEEGRFDELAGTLERIESSRLFYRDMLSDMLRQPSPLSFGPAFVEFANLYVLAAGAKARALVLLRGEERALPDIEMDAESFRSLRREFLAPLDDPEGRLASLIAITEQAEAALVACLPALPNHSAADFVRLPGVTRDRAILNEIILASQPEPDEPPGAIVSAAFAPNGWSPAADRESHPD